MPFPHTFYFLRHGETTWNAAKMTQGQMNSPLSERGRAQAEAAAQALKDEPIERIIASPLDRARHTAEAVGRATGIDVETDPNLMECHLGDHQGKPHAPFLRMYFANKYAPPNGETFTQFRDRVWEAMVSAVARGPNTLIVAHGGLWIAARTHVSIAPDLSHMPNALPLKVTPRAGHWDHEIMGGIEPAPPTITI